MMWHARALAVIAFLEVMACAKAGPPATTPTPYLPRAAASWTCPANPPLTPPSCTPEKFRGRLLQDEPGAGFRVFEECGPGGAGIFVEHIGTHVADDHEMTAIGDAHRAALSKNALVVGVGTGGGWVGIDLRSGRPLETLEWLVPIFADTGDVCFPILVMETGEYQLL